MYGNLIGGCDQMGFLGTIRVCNFFHEINAKFDSVAAQLGPAHHFAGTTT